MKRVFKSVAVLTIAAWGFSSCVQDEVMSADPYNLSSEEMAAIEGAGFSTDGAWRGDDGSLWIENDINLTVNQLAGMKPGSIVNEQYSTDNLVNAGSGRLITIYMEVETSGGGGGGGGNGNGKGGGKPGGSSAAAAFPSTYDAALNEAISRFNSENLTISFARSETQNGADIVISRLGKRDERRGVLGSAGFPTNSGDPYGSIRMSGILQSTYGISVNGIASILAHEIGHCIGFRHTDYFNRAISCGSGGNEGDAGVGANHIPGTPTGASLSDQSWMLSRALCQLMSHKVSSRHHSVLRLRLKLHWPAGRRQ